MKKIIVFFLFFIFIHNLNSQLKYSLIYPLEEIFITNPKLNEYDTFVQDSFEIIIKLLDLKGKSTIKVSKNGNEYQFYEYSNGEFLLTDVIESINIETGISHFKYFEFYYPILYSLEEKNKKKKFFKYDPSEYIKIKN